MGGDPLCKLAMVWMWFESVLQRLLCWKPGFQCGDVVAWGLAEQGGYVFRGDWRHFVWPLSWFSNKVAIKDNLGTQQPLLLLLIPRDSPLHMCTCHCNTIHQQSPQNWEVNKPLFKLKLFTFKYFSGATENGPIMCGKTPGLLATSSLVEKTIGRFYHKG